MNLSDLPLGEIFWPSMVIIVTAAVAGWIADKGLR